jgi:hypothetical protein
LLAISRCFAGSIAANPRFDPPLFVAAMSCLPTERLHNAAATLRFTLLIEISQRPFADERPG